MSEFFIGQIMMTGFNFAPKYFAACNGQLLPIAQNQALFSLLGTQYGGNGTTNFALPDLRGRTPVGYAPFLGDRHNEHPHIPQTAIPHAVGSLGKEEGRTVSEEQGKRSTHQVLHG